VEEDHNYGVEVLVELLVVARKEEAYFDLQEFHDQWKKHSDVSNDSAQTLVVRLAHSLVANYSMEGLMVFADVRSMKVQLEVDAMTAEMELDSRMMEKGLAHAHKVKWYSARKRDVAAVVLDP
jgi:hypothetical protein